MLNQARDFAIAAHGDQTYGEQPYVFHLDAVVAHLTDFGEPAQVVGYLHDVVEDTPTTSDDIEQVFGEFVSQCVAIVTDEPGKNRKERKTKTYAKMSKVEGNLSLALVVKAADRLANLESCVKDENQGLLDMYKKEHAVFEPAVFRENLCDDLWVKI